MEQAPEPQQPEDDDVLDAYSRTVMRVAAAVTPHVAAIEMTAQRRNGRVRVGAGSAVLFTEDGYLLTNSHVVAGTTAEIHLEMWIYNFGPNRLMFGSDWPPCTLEATYAQVCATARALTTDLSEPDRSAIFSGTARTTYRLR